MKWSVEAEAAIRRAPFFVRNLARHRAEEEAVSRGHELVSLEDVQQARESSRPRLSAVATQNVVSDCPGGGPAAAVPTPGAQEAIAPESQAKCIEDFVERASQVPGIKTRHYDIRVCGGALGCPFALIDVRAQAEALREVVETSGWCDALDARSKGPILAHHKFRAAIAGCPNACSEPQVRDFGVLGQVKPGRSGEPCTQCEECVTACRESAVRVDDTGPHIDYVRCMNCELCVRACPTGTLVGEDAACEVTVGGKLGRHPRLADTLLKLTDQAGVIAASREVLELMKSEGGRVADIVERVGLETLQERIHNRKEHGND